MTRLLGKVALVTGGGAGLGKAIAMRLASDGAYVFISDVDSEAGKLAAEETGIAFLEHDVTDQASWLGVIRIIEDQRGPLTTLINNAAISGSPDCASPENTHIADWRRVLAVNLDGVFLGCKSAIPSMRKAGGGAIVNISSTAALLATPFATAYGASKAAVRQLTKSVAQHCAEERLGIRCNSIHPGVVLTSFWMKHAQARAEKSGVTVEQLIEDAEIKNPMGKLATPEDIAAACAFLVSDEARHVNGAKLVVDGGVVSCSTFRSRSKLT